MQDRLVYFVVVLTSSNESMRKVSILQQESHCYVPCTLLTAGSCIIRRYDYHTDSYFFTVFSFQ